MKSKIGMFGLAGVGSLPWILQNLPRLAADRNMYSAGDLLVIDPSAKRHLSLGENSYPTLASGVCSTKPGMLGSAGNIDEPAAKDEIELSSLASRQECKGSGN